MDAAKKRVIDELIKKFDGEEGERMLVMPFLEGLSKISDSPVTTIIMGQKSTLELVEDDMEKLLANDTFPEPIDRELAIAEKVAEAVGIVLDLPTIDQDVDGTIVKYLGQTGVQPVAHMMSRIVAEESTTVPGLSKFEKMQRSKKLKSIKDVLTSATSRNLYGSDISKDLKIIEIRKKINSLKKEHDIAIVKGDYRTIMQTEVKSMKAKQNHEVTKALKQLLGGREEYARIHGHVLDPDWTFVGVVALPNLPAALKAEVVQDLKICSDCSAYLLVGAMEPAVDNLLKTTFFQGLEFPDEALWLQQYKRLTSRLLAMDHLIQPIPEVQRITGRNEEIVAAFTPGLFWQIVLFSSNEP